MKQAKLFEEMLDKRLRSEAHAARASVDAEGWCVYWWKKGAEKSACPRIVPSNFKMPVDLTPQTAWQQWWAAHPSGFDAGVQLPPIKVCTYFHLPREAQPRWKEWSSLFEECFNALPDGVKKELLDAFKARDMPLALLNRSYGLVVATVDLYRQTSKRKAQVKMGTVLRNRAVAAAASRAQSNM